MIRLPLNDAFALSHGLLAAQAPENYQNHRSGKEPLRFDVLKILGAASFDDLDALIADQTRGC